MTSEYLNYNVEDDGFYKPYENLEGYWKVPSHAGTSFLKI